MSAFLLDTVTVSELRKIDRIDPRVRDWQDNHVGDEMWLSVVTPLEIRQGIHQVRCSHPLDAPAHGNPVILSKTSVAIQLSYPIPTRSK